MEVVMSRYRKHQEGIAHSKDMKRKRKQYKHSGGDNGANGGCFKSIKSGCSTIIWIIIVLAIGYFLAATFGDLHR